MGIFSTSTSFLNVILLALLFANRVKLAAALSGRQGEAEVDVFADSLVENDAENIQKLVNVELKNFYFLVRPSLYGFFIVWFSWLLIYFDSKVPGVYPPSPVSPKKNRNMSGHTFHLNYAIGLVNGFITFALILWQQTSN